MSDMQNRTRNMAPVTHRDSMDFFLVKARARVLQETTYDGWLKVSKSFENELKRHPTGYSLVATQYGLSVAYAKMNQKDKALAAIRAAKAASKEKSVILDKHLSELTYQVAKTQAQKDQALAVAKGTCEQYPYSGLAASNYVELLFQSGKHQELVDYLRKQSALSRTNPDYHMYLARSYEALGKKSMAFAATGDMYALLDNPRAAVYQFELAQKANDGDFYRKRIDYPLRTGEVVFFPYSKQRDRVRKYAQRFACVQDGFFARRFFARVKLTPPYAQRIFDRLKRQLWLLKII